MIQRELLSKFGTPCTFSELETTRLTEPPTSFYVLPTHFETILPLEIIVSRIDALFEGDAFPFRTTLRGKETVINDTGFNWKMRQEKIAEEYCDEEHEETYCCTSINILRKKSKPNVFLVEAVRLNGNHKMFQKNWRELQIAFDMYQIL